jgi:hypothetical protein
MAWTEVSKALDERLYPDVARAGGLPQALQQALEARGSALKVTGVEPPFLVYAQVSCDDRSSQVMAAATERAFSVDFWNQGVQYGSGWTTSLEEAGRAIALFVGGETAIERLQAEITWFTPTASGRDHELGPAQMVTRAWDGLHGWLSKGEPADSPMRRLLPLIVEAMKRPELRQLFPFTSMDYFCVSRTTGYPYTNDCATAHPIDGGRFEVLAGSRRLGEGDAEVAADLMVSTLPPGCGPASHGTSADRPVR